jgi:ribosomal protein S18 acetylase RimI-like enzyme
MDNYEVIGMPKLRLKVESILHKYLASELTDEGFRRGVQLILAEFEGKSLLHKNIGQLIWRMEREKPSEEHKFKKIWALLDQVSPRIREDLQKQWKIRLAMQGDIEEIMKFDHIARIRSRQDRRDFIRRSVLNKKCYVAVVEGKPVGYTVLQYDFWDFGGGFISMLLVHEDFRRRGIGSELVEYVEGICKKEKLFTSTNQSNKAMQSLLEKMKYKKSGIIHNLDPGDPELIYFKKITQN